MPLDRSILEKTFSSPYGEAAYLLCEKLIDAGFEAWFVGGGVRDMLQGHLPKDIDIATSAKPEDIERIFPDSDATSAALGSMRVTLHRFEFEVTTFRSDDELSDGRHPKSITFSDRAHDAQRRDFTVNVLYLQPVTRELYDPFGGEQDLKQKLIRFIGEPAVRIQHDALRILRAVRFRALLDGQYHPDTYAALREHAKLTEILSGQRVRLELEKILLGPKPQRALEDLWEISVLRYLIPELFVCKGVPQPAEYHQEGDVWDHLLQCVAHFRDDDNADVRFATLFHDIGKSETFALKERIRFDHHAQVSAQETAKILTRLQMPTQRREKICWLIEHHMMMGSFLEMPEERKGHWYYHPWFPDLLRVFRLDIEGTVPSDFSLYEAIVKDETAYLDSHPRPKKPLLTGEDVMELLGLRPGEEVGKALKALHDAQQKKEVSTKAEAKTFLTQWSSRAA